jgi:hypothetical protein
MHEEMKGSGGLHQYVALQASEIMPSRDPSRHDKCSANAAGDGVRTYEASRQGLISPGHNQATSSSHDHLRNCDMKAAGPIQQVRIPSFRRATTALIFRAFCRFSVMHRQLISGYSHQVKGLAKFH